MLKNIVLVSFGSLLTLSVLACDGGGGATGSTSAAGTGKPAATAAKTAAATAAATATATAAAAADKMAEYDLSAAGDKWKGYFASLPREGAKVMADGADGARLATGGREENPFDLAWAPGKGHLADLKKGLTDAAKSGNVKTEFVVDTPEGIEYVNTYEGGTKTYHFDLVMKVGTAEFHCYTLPMGVDNEAQYKKHKDACKTLTKK